MEFKPYPLTIEQKREMVLKWRKLFIEGHTMKKAAQLLGISHQAIRKWEEKLFPIEEK